MGIPSLLKAYESEPGFKTYARAFKAVERELGALRVQPESAEILSRKDQAGSPKKFFALEKAMDADRWLAVNARVDGRLIRFLGPFRRGVSLPYSLEIGLSAPAPFTASLTRNLMLSPRWQVLPKVQGNEAREVELQALGLPPVGWRHQSGGLPVLLSEGGRIGNVVGERRAAWTVFSAYQGFVFNVGPRIAKYVQAAGKLDGLLHRWANAPNAQPAPAEPRATSGPSPSAEPAKPPEPELEEL